MVRIHSPRPTNPLKSITRYWRLARTAFQPLSRHYAQTYATFYALRSLYRGTGGVGLRVHIRFRRGKIAKPCQIGQNLPIHSSL